MNNLEALSFYYYSKEKEFGEKAIDDCLKYFAALDKEHFSWYWPLGEWEASFKQRPLPFIIAGLFNSKGPKALALFHYPLKNETAHLLKFLIAPEYRRTGISTLFHALCLKQLAHEGVSHLYLEVEEGNLPAIQFYQKCGWSVFNLKKDFYGPKRNAWAMGLQFREEGEVSRQPC